MAQFSLPTIRTNAPASKGCGYAFGAVWILGWSTITLLFDGVLAFNAFRDLRALTYPTAQAVVTQSSVKDAGGDGDSTGLEVKYRFNVRGKEYIGAKLRYNEMSSNDGWAEKAIADYPVGGNVTAYYNPRDPADAVLHTGLQGTDLFMAMFLTPFNIIMLGSWYVAKSQLSSGRESSPTSGLKVIDCGTDITVSLPQVAPLLVAAAALLAASFVMIFVVGFWKGFHAPLDFMLIVWTIVLGLAGVAWAKAAQPIWSGTRDLHIDVIARKLILPQTFGRTEAVEVPFDTVTGVAVEQQPGRHRQEAVASLFVTLYSRNAAGNTDGARLIEFYNKSRAEAFAEWLRTKLK